jgi:NAD(P)-dependent dehydrogenase (short-subunit alcohol dehydrogenase family)
MGSVKDKVVFITGGARGIGAEVARQLYAKGANLVLTDLDEIALREVSSELDGDRVLTLVADVRDFASMEYAVSRAVGQFGGVDVVIGNAGISTYGTVLNVQPAAFKTLIDVNVLGVFHTVRAALPSVIERRGYVLVVSSMFAYAAQPGGASYCMSNGQDHLGAGLRGRICEGDRAPQAAYLLPPVGKCAALAAAAAGHVRRRNSGAKGTA